LSLGTSRCWRWPNRSESIFASFPDAAHPYDGGGTYRPAPEGSGRHWTGAVRKCARLSRTRSHGNLRPAMVLDLFAPSVGTRVVRAPSEHPPDRLNLVRVRLRRTRPHAVARGTVRRAV
jgi:hypothetical protein